MSVFHEVVLPHPFAFGATGGPERRVDIVRLGSGRETRNAPWAHGRRRFDIGGAVRSLDQLHALIGFYEARRGKLHGFRFRDPFDFKSCPPQQTPSAFDIELGVGDGVRTAFQLRKLYGEAPHAYERIIAKPVVGSVRVAVAGVEREAGFILDETTGVIDFAEAPEAGALIQAGFLFDTPVRFDADRLDLSIDAFGAGRALSVPLIEVTP